MELNLKVIHDPAKFKRLVKQGQRFYWLSSWDGEPVGYESAVFEGYTEKDEDKLILSGHLPYFSKGHMFLSDLMNRHHGVFLTEEDAMKGWEGAKEIWNNNPEIREEEAKRSAEIRAIFMNFPDVEDDILLN